MPELPINTENRQTARHIRNLVLNSGDTITLTKNGVEVFSFTMPQNKDFNGRIGLEGVVTNR